VSCVYNLVARNYGEQKYHPSISCVCARHSVVDASSNRSFGYYEGEEVSIME
jgi:hypothetical protein